MSFESQVEILPFAWLICSNALLLLLTLGLAHPVTQIRKASYLASVTRVHLEPGADELINQVLEHQSAFGEEAAGFFDADISLV